MKATHKKIKQMVGFQEIELEPGQFVFGLKKCSKDTGLSIQTVRGCLKAINGKKLTRKTTNKFSIITIINWPIYQMADDDINNQINKQATIKQQSNNNQTTTNKNVKKYKNDKNNIYTSNFLMFWGAYPKKVGKGAAFKSWQKTNNRPPIDTLLKIIEAHKQTEQWQRDNGQYIPHPATWLNQRRFEDEIEQDLNERKAQAWIKGDLGK